MSQNGECNSRQNEQNGIGGEEESDMCCIKRVEEMKDRIKRGI